MADNEQDDLGVVAAEGLAGVESQPILDLTNATKVKFVGMAFDSFEDDIAIGDEREFRVRARCIGVGDEARKSDSVVRHIAKMDVLGVSRIAN